MYTCANRIVERSRMRVKMLSENTVLKNPMVKVEDNRIYLDSLYKNFENAFQGILNEKKQSLALNASKHWTLSVL